MMYEKFMLSDGIVGNAEFIGTFNTDLGVEYSVLSVSGKELMTALDGKESNELLIIGDGIYRSMNPYGSFTADRNYYIVLFDDNREFIIMKNFEEVA